MSRSSEGLWILLGCAALGLVGRNPLIVATCLALVALRLLRLNGPVQWLLHRGTTAGVFLLLLALMAPVAAERVPLKRFASELLSRQGLTAVILAAAGAWLGRVGVVHMKSRPEVLVGLIVGSALGTLLLRGIPTGPLILAGLTALLTGIWSH